LHNARNAGRCVVRRLDAARYWSYFGLFGVRNSTSGMVGNGGSSAKRRACRAARRAVRAASFFVASGLRRIGCSEKGMFHGMSLERGIGLLGWLPGSHEPPGGLYEKV
jgi:hypothetical protein